MQSKILEKSKSLFFQVKYNILVTPMLRFPYFSASRLYNLPTFRYAGSTVSLFFGTPARRFPYFPAHRLDDSPTFRHTGSTISLLVGTPVRQVPYLSACLLDNFPTFHACQACWKGPNWHRAFRRLKTLDLNKGFN